MIHIESIQVVTDRPLGDRQARSVGASFAQALDAALRGAATQGRSEHSVHIDHVRLELPADAMHDRLAMREVVHGVARRILERAGE